MAKNQFSKLPRTVNHPKMHQDNKFCGLECSTVDLYILVDLCENWSFFVNMGFPIHFAILRVAFTAFLVFTACL